jgi:hypothetical protein
MGYKPGQSGNPKGRPPGRRGLDAGALFVLRVEREKCPVAFLEAVTANNAVPLQTRTQAAGLLLPYKAPRCTERFISKPIDLPVSTDAVQAKANITAIKALAAAGRLGLDEANDLIAMEVKVIEAYAVVEMQIDLQATERAFLDNPPPLEVEVAGGLPVAPGMEGVRMPPRKLPLPRGSNPWSGKPKREDGS